jgi:hypothetical protein
MAYLCSLHTEAPLVTNCMQAVNLAGKEGSMETILEHHFPGAPSNAPMCALNPLANPGPQPWGMYGGQMPLAALGNGTW